MSAEPATTLAESPGSALGSEPEILLRAEGVTRRFGGLLAVKEVDLVIPRGGIISLIGPNGAGKTTLFNVVAGIISPTSGTVRFRDELLITGNHRTWLESLLWILPSAIAIAIGLLLGANRSEAGIGLTGAAAVGLLVAMLVTSLARPGWYHRFLLRLGVIRSARPNDVVAAGIGRTFQNIRLFKNMTVLENVLVGMHLQMRANLIDHFASSRRQAREEEEARQRARELLLRVGLRGREDELAKNLPYGDQRRLEVARALGNKPALLLLDEPTAGMNPRETTEMTALIGRLRDDLGISILLIEHDMRVVMGISDRITVLDHGEQIAEGTPEEVRRDPRVIEAYLGKPAAGPTRPTTPASATPLPDQGSEFLLRLRGIHSYYGHIHALQGIDIDVRPGEIVTLLGTNGAGKTTTLRTICGLMHPRTGTVEFEGKDVSQVASHQLVDLGVGHAPEGRRIFSRLTVLENLQMGGYTRKAAEVREDVEHVYALFPRLRERAGQKGGTLSGGEQQMLAIGRALMTRPKVLLLDEPSLGLSPILVQQIFSIIGEINAQGMTILLVEQNALQALAIANRGYVLQTGRVVLSGTSDELSSNEMVRKAYLGED